MRIPIKAITIFVLLLSACSTIPNISYYMLPDVATESSTISLKVSRIELSEYIDHQDIVLELDTSSFHRANFHKWSEPLEDGIARLLERSLTKEKPIPIELAITRFHGKESGYLTLSGKWRETETNNEEFIWKPFKFESTLPKSGYDSMIESQAQLVAALHQEIVKTISNK